MKNRLVKYHKLLTSNFLTIIPVIVVALSMLYVVYREISIPLITSMIIITFLYMREKHPSFLGLVTHLTIMFSISLLIVDNIINIVISIILSISLLSYIVSLTLHYDVNALRSNWPASLLLLSYSSFIGMLLSFLNTRILYQVVAIIGLTIIVSGYKYLLLKHNIKTDDKLNVNMISGETVKLQLKIYNPIKDNLYYRVEWYNKAKGLKIKTIGNNLITSGLNYIPIEVMSEEPGLYNLRLGLIFEDSHRLARVHREVLIRIKAAPKIKIALLAAHKLLNRLPREILEQAPGQKPSNIVFNPRQQASRRGEYYGARQYVPGDDLSQIHWKKSLSKLVLISKERRQSHSSSLIILVDTSSYDNRDYANILYSLLSTLIGISLQDPIKLVSIAIYDINNTYVILFDDYVTRILYKIIKMIEEGIISTTIIPKKTLDKNIASIIASMNEEKVSALYNYLISSVKDKYVWKIITRMIEESSSNIIMFIHGENVVSDIYLIVESILLRKGFVIQRPLQIPPRILYKKAVEESIGIS